MQSTRRSRARALVLATAVAAGSVTAAAAPASARISEGTIKSECRDAGGSYATAVMEGIRFSTCTYRGMNGTTYRDYYADGEYYSTRP